MSGMTKQVTVGSVKIGGGADVSVQSMLNVPAHDIEGNIKQALTLQSAGCEIIRAAVPDMESVKLISALKKSLSIPVVADIHFDYRLAMESVAAGADKIRINPGNIGADDRVKAVADCCRAAGVPIRVGVNSGSLNKDSLAKYGRICAAALVDSALYDVALLEKFGFDDIVISIKSSDVRMMVEGYELISQRCAYPLHLGVTEAGTLRSGTVKSAVGIGALLLRGIGDTIRVSLSGDPLEEVAAGREILKAVGLNKEGVEIISCPTCGRTQIDLVSIANEIERRTAGIKKKLKIAVMGCVVNGPGEAGNADIGIAGGRECAVLFKKGEIVGKISGDIVGQLMSEIEKMV